MTVRASVDVVLEPLLAFDVFVEELAAALAGRGMAFVPRQDGRITDGESDVGRVVSWQPGKSIMLEWRQADWEPHEVTKIELLFEPVQDGTRVTMVHHDWGRLLDDRGGELVGWFAREVIARLLQSMAPSRFGDWLTDRRARRPAGGKARDFYRDPIYHRPNFQAILNELRLTADDYLLEVGCGGGAFLHEALKSGCKAAAVDHSPEMVKVAREVNREAMIAGRLEILEAEADQLPYPDSSFTCAVMTGVLNFLPNSDKVLASVWRALVKGGRFILYAGSKELKGTPAAPEPIASKLTFYDDADLEQLARRAGFVDIRVERPDLEKFARESGVPEEALHFFSGRGGQLLIAHKS